MHICKRQSITRHPAQLLHRLKSSHPSRAIIHEYSIRSPLAPTKENQRRQRKETSRKNKTAPRREFTCNPVVAVRARQRPIKIPDTTGRSYNYTYTRYTHLHPYAICTRSRPDFYTTFSAPSLATRSSRSPLYTSPAHNFPYFLAPHRVFTKSPPIIARDLKVYIHALPGATTAPRDWNS